jgi:diguanylate cyclase (GGDEF)-like protein/PAS domain S-box-containing protein
MFDAGDQTHNMIVAGGPIPNMDRFELAAQEANNGLWDWDLTTNRIHFSSRWNSMLGSEESIFGNTPEEWFSRIHPEDREQVQREINTHLENGSVQFALQHRMLHKDSSYRWMSCHAVITRDRDGKAVRIAGSHSDTNAEKVVDDLTGLPNRTLLLDRLTRSIETTKRHSDKLFAVLILDLDLPEYVTSRFGPTDCALLVVAAARRLETCLRVADTLIHPGCDHVVARSDGDEFIILLDGLNEVGESKIVAERLLKEISAPFEVNGREVFLSASIGIALSASGYRNAHVAIRDAGTALHRAKALGKGRCEVFDTAILESVQAELEFEADLQGALERQEFYVAYQPIVSLASKQIAGFEALLRWRHPVRGLVSPLEFIPVAEKTGLIVPLGNWVIGEACRQVKIWKENPQIPKDLWVSVNLSSVQFKHPSLVKDFCKIILDVDFDANGLILELTEGGVMENPDAANRILMQLRVTGARIALDDFGTGYSSLAHLCRFPLDYLKIDRSFVRNIETNKNARDIVRTISSLAHQLGLCVIAEGIERPGQLDLIRSLGCEYGQGFLFSKAVGNDKVQALLKDGFPSWEVNNNTALIANEGEMKPGLHIQDALMLPAVNPDSDKPQIEEKGRNFRVSRATVLICSAVIFLLLIVGLLAGINSPTPMPATEEIPMPVISDVKLEPPPEPPPKAAGIAKKKIPVPVYNYPVVHSHFMGKCKGTLKVTRDTLSYISENEKCNFNLNYADFDYSLDRDQLEIKAEAQTYHFSSTNAPTKEENQSQLQEIFQSISRYHPEPAKKNQ